MNGYTVEVTTHRESRSVIATRHCHGSRRRRERAGGGAARQSGAPNRAQARIGYVFVCGYTVLLLVFGILPTLYAMFIAFTKGGALRRPRQLLRVSTTSGSGPRSSTSRFTWSSGWSHCWSSSCCWRCWSTRSGALAVDAVRFVYYIPGALAGASSVMLWLFVLDPSVSPVSGVLRALRLRQLRPDGLARAICPSSSRSSRSGPAPAAGSSSCTARSTTSRRSAGGRAHRRRRSDATAWSIQLPLLRKWISYMVIMSLAGGTQLFVEPRCSPRPATAWCRRTIR